MKTDLYIPRSYRIACQHNALVSSTVRVGYSDLYIRTDKYLSDEALAYLSGLYQELESYIECDSNFLTSLKPVRAADHAPDIIKKMAAASMLFGVGPMAAVAGAISEQVARHLRGYSKRVFIENGGDLFIINDSTTRISLIFNICKSGGSFSFELTPHPRGISICTSSGTIGHSLSFGRAHAVTVISPSGYSADAAATALCNMVQNDNDVEKVIEYARNFTEITGLIIVMNNRVGIFGDMIRVI